MNNRIHLFLAACAMAFLATGCAVRPVTFKEYSRSLPKLSAAEGRIWFYRLGGQGTYQPAIVLDGQRIGVARPNKAFYVDVSAGQHQVVCTSEWAHKLDLNLAPQTTHFVRLHTVPGNAAHHVIPRDTDPAVAQDEISVYQLTR